MALRKTVRIGLLAALSLAFMYWIEVPIPPFPVYLKYDPSEVPALIGGFALGPWAGIAVVFIKDLLYMFSGKNQYGLIGILPNFLAGATLVLVAGMVYQQWRTKTGGIVALVAGSVVMTVTMAVANYFWFLPVFYHLPKENILPLITSAIIPFNLVKAAISSVVTFLVYKRVSLMLGAPATLPKVVSEREN